MTVNRKVLSKEVLNAFSKLEPCCKIITKTNWDITKVRYYHDGDYYKPHTDASMQFLAFSYFYKEPKKFTGGELFFPEYDYELTCDNNSLIMFPGWVEHGVKKVSIKYPKSINDILNKEKKSLSIDSYSELKDFLLSRV